MSVTDPVLLSVQTDAVLLVIRSGRTTAAHLRRACNILRSVKTGLLGIVVNAADLGSPDYYYYSYGARNPYYAKREKKNGKTNSNSSHGPDESTDYEQDEVTPMSS
jgi:Mrp family chromosome partitioning ATPase